MNLIQLACAIMDLVALVALGFAIRSSYKKPALCPVPVRKRRLEEHDFRNPE